MTFEEFEADLRPYNGEREFPLYTKFQLKEAYHAGAIEEVKKLGENLAGMTSYEIYRELESLRAQIKKMECLSKNYEWHFLREGFPPPGIYLWFLPQGKFRVATAYTMATGNQNPIAWRRLEYPNIAEVKNAGSR